MAVLGFTALSLISCNQSPRRQPDAREAGRQAYQASQNLKRDAKQAAHQLHDAEQQFREGWDEAQRADQARQNNPRSQPPPGADSKNR